MSARGRAKKRKAKAKASNAPPAKRRRLLLGAGGTAVMILLVLTWFVFRTPGSTRGFPGQLTPGSARGFNVLLITLDTTRADRLGCYGYAGARTPVLDGLASEGIRFDDAVVATPSTLPSHATILTGLDAPNHGVRSNGQYRLGEDKLTLAEVLREQGFETAAFTSSFVVDSRFGLDQGFDLYDDDIGVADAFVGEENSKYRLGEYVTDAAMAWLEDRHEQQPFFCWVHYYDPHTPRRPPPPFDVDFRDDPYDGEIAYMDSQIGRLLGSVRATGLWEKTVMIVVGDHGEGLGEHGEKGHARLVYESVMGAPLIVTCPGLFRGPYVVDNVVVSIADVFPTVLELLGIEGAPPVDGLSLLKAADHADRMIYMESITPYLENGWSPLYGLRRHADKYILAPRPEYYDLRNDPDELSNLYPHVLGAELVARDELVSELASRLAKWPSLGSIVAGAGQLDPESLRRLQSLGYVGTTSVDGTEEDLPDPKDMIGVVADLARAETAMHTGRLDQALDIVSAAAELSRCDHDVHHLRGKIYLRMGREREAEGAFLAANKCQPNDSTYLMLGQILVKNGRFEEAARALDQADQMHPGHGGVYIARGDLYALRRRPQEALASYRHAADVDAYRYGSAAQRRMKRLLKAFPRLEEP